MNDKTYIQRNLQAFTTNRTQTGVSLLHRAYYEESNAYLSLLKDDGKTTTCVIEFSVYLSFLTDRLVFAITFDENLYEVAANAIKDRSQLALQEEALNEHLSHLGKFLSGPKYENRFMPLTSEKDSWLQSVNDLSEKYANRATANMLENVSQEDVERVLTNLMLQSRRVRTNTVDNGQASSSGSEVKHER
jgi:hypothetical protein